MALRIKENNGIFSVEGALNANTSKQLEAYFETVLNLMTSLEINIENVNEIDTNGLLVLYKLYKKADVYRKPFTITGQGCDAIYNEFQLTEIAA